MTGISSVKGPPMYENWRAELEGSQPNGAYEVPLFTDAHITGMITDGYGPYQFINTVPGFEGRGTLRPSIVLRVENRLNFEDNSREETQEDHYHGGNLADEVASLVSLCLGIRAKSGHVSRDFSRGGDPRGIPRALGWTNDPVLLKNTERLILPNASGTHNLNSDLMPILSLPLVSPFDATALIRAARLYQDSLWIVESEPNLSWIMLVSAIETAANHWRNSRQSDVDRLQEWNSELVDLLREKGGDELLSQVAAQIAHLTGATKKFLDFIFHFLPAPPDSRPEKWAQHPWSKNKLKATLQKIYTYRSRALHGGTPFPAPMCKPPFLQSNNAFEEKPSAISISMGGHTWVAKDIPIYLHTFEYIVRNALLKWWESMIPQPDPAIREPAN